MSAKILYLVRHGKSSWKDSSLSDRERPLKKRGERDAHAMARYLAEKKSVPVSILSSPALRALATAKIFAKEIGYPIENIAIDGELYFSGIETMLNIVKNIEESFSEVMLVGHNPDMTDFLNHLANQTIFNMPTSAVAIITFKNCAWAEIEFGLGELLSYDYPKKFQSLEW